MIEIQPTDWQQRLRAAVAATLRQRAACAAERRELAARRRAGLDRRHATKLARLESVVSIGQSTDRRCRYLVQEVPSTRCPNESAPGFPLCRPHLTAVAALAKRIGLLDDPECCSADPTGECPQHRQAARVLRHQGPRPHVGRGQAVVGPSGKAKPAPTED